MGELFVGARYKHSRVRYKHSRVRNGYALLIDPVPRPSSRSQRLLSPRLFPRFPRQSPCPPRHHRRQLRCTDRWTSTYLATLFTRGLSNTPIVFFARVIYTILNLCARSSSPNAMIPCSQAGDRASHFDVGPTESHWPEDKPKIVQYRKGI